jgi:hypothetical protein
MTQTKEEAAAEFETMNAEMDAAEGITPAKDETGQNKTDDKSGTEKTEEAEKVEDKETGAEDKTDGKSGEEEVDPNIAKSKAGTEPGVQKKIDKMRATTTAAQNDAAYWKGRAESAELKGKPNQAEEAEEAEPVAKKALDPDDFETIEEFEEAKMENMVDEKLAAREKKAKEESAKEVQATKEEEAATRTLEQGLEAKKRYEDFDKVVKGDNPNLNVLPPATAQMVLDSDVGADLAYKIGKDPDLATRLAKMTPAQAIREIVALEVPFVKTETTPTKQKTKTVSDAPEPISAPTGGSGGGEVDEDLMDINDWMKRENARDAKKRYGG